MFFRKDAYQPFNAAAAAPGQKSSAPYSEKKKKISCLCERFLNLIIFHLLA